jgi:hypothetical protein
VREVRLETLRYAVQQRISGYVAESMRAESVQDVMTNDLIMRLEVGVLAETLPPLNLTRADPFTVPRFATWLDHFVATYRGRWWGRPLRRHVLRYVDEPHTHRTTVDVRTHWTYPQATTVLPGRNFGHVVLKSEAHWRPTDFTDPITPW